MTDFTRPGSRSGRRPDATADRPSRRRLAFSGNNDFQRSLRVRVDAWFAETGRRKQDLVEFYFKAGSILAAFAVSYVLLVFFATNGWQAVPLAIVLALATVGIGFNIMHDGGHGAISKRRGINRLLAHSLDIVGGSSYLWRWKHGVLHHNYANITDHDMDVALGPLARFTPHQPHYAHQRWQHWYVWALYCLMSIKWQLVDDFRTLATGKIGRHRIPRPRGKDLFWLVSCKLAFFTLAFVVPLLLHSFWAVLGIYLLYSVVLSLALSVVFQLAHCVGEADFPVVADGTNAVENAWAVHQVQTTVNFCRDNRPMTWLLGGLNYQIEHHLFPEINHCNYPDIAGIVRDTCAEFGVNYKEHGSFAAAIASHFRWLRLMGTPAAIPA